MIPEGAAPFSGVYAATPAPLTTGFALDEPNLRALLAELAAVPGLSGFLVNGHAGENASMPLADQCRIAEIAAETIGDRTTVISGVNVENSDVMLPPQTVTPAQEHAALRTALSIAREKPQQ